MIHIKKYFTINALKSIVDQIQTIEDIFRLSGKSRSEIVPWKSPVNKQQRSQNAYALLQVITEVYNKGFVFDWNNSDQYKYSNYFIKNAHGYWVWYCCRCWGSITAVGLGLYFKNPKLGKDAAKKFIDIYIDYLPE